MKGGSHANIASVITTASGPAAVATCPVDLACEEPHNLDPTQSIDTLRLTKPNKMFDDITKSLFKILSGQCDK